MEPDHVAVLLEDLRSTIQTVADGVVLANERLDRHTLRFDRLEGAVLDLAGDVRGLKRDVSTLKADVSVLKTDVAGLKSDMAIVKADISELRSDLAAVKAEDPPARLH